MENLIFLIILGLISTVFSKKNNNRKNNGPVRKKNPPVSPSYPSNKEEGNNWDVPMSDWEKRLKELDKRFSNPWLQQESKVDEQKSTIKAKRLSESEAKRKENTTNVVMENENLLENKRRAAKEAKAAQQQMRNEESSDEILTPNEAIQGMMWAEVFGPPRSRNPHRIIQKKND